MRIMGLDRKLGSNRDNTSIVTTNFSISTKSSVPYTYQSKAIYDSKNLLLDSRDSENIQSQIQSWLTDTIFLIFWNTSCFQVKKLGSWSTLPPRLNRPKCVSFLGFTSIWMWFVRFVIFYLKQELTQKLKLKDGQIKQQ